MTERDLKMMNHRSHHPVRVLLGAAVVIASLVGVAGPSGAATAYDNFADRLVIPGTTNTAVASNVGATVESGEPGSSIAHTIWFSWGATFTGSALFTTTGSEFDTVLAVYTGTNLGNLQQLDFDDDDGPGTRSRIEVDVVAGTQYHLQVDGFSGAAGGVRIWVNPVTFDDTPRTYAFWRDVEWVADEGIAQGYADGGYHPAANISRGAMSAFLVRLAGATPPAPATATFADVGTNHPFFAEIEWMNDQGITTGYPGNLFKPASPVTRQAMSAFLYRFGGSPPFTPPGSATFSDVPLSHDFFAEIEWMNAEGITTGYPGNLFKPGGLVTRGAMAAFLHRFDT
jgi:hypothetical protein